LAQVVDDSIQEFIVEKMGAKGPGCKYYTYELVDCQYSVGYGQNPNVMFKIGSGRKERFDKHI